MTTTDLAAALLRDVPRYEPDNPLDSAPSMKDDPQGDWLSRAEVLAALSRVLDPAIAERAGEVVERLRGRPDAIEDVGRLRDEAADLITALLAQNAALRAERGAVLGMYMRSSDEGFRQKARAEAAETTLAAMTKERDAKVATDAVEQMIRNLRDCANGMGSFKTNRGDFGLCDDAADMISAIAAHRDALNILSAEDVAVHQEAISRAEAAEAERDAIAKKHSDLQDSITEHCTECVKGCEALRLRLTAAEAEVEKLRGALMVARVHVANNAEGWSVSRGAARDDLTIVDAALALTTEADNDRQA